MGATKFKKEQIDFSDFITTIESINLIVANWTLVGDFYEYDYANASILADSIVEVIPYNSSIEVVKAAEIMPMVVSSVGTLKITSKNLPTGDILIAINIQ